MKYQKTDADRLRDAIDRPDFFAKAAGIDSHLERHLCLSDKQMMTRLFSDTKAASTFEDEDNAQYLIKEAMYNAADEIIAWQETAKQWDDHAFDVKLDADDYGTVGRGFRLNQQDNMIREETTDTLRFVLMKDKHADFGFTLKTAYPNMYSYEGTEATGRDLSDVVKETSQYQDAGAVKQAYLLYRCRPDAPYLATFKAGLDVYDDAMTLHVPARDDRDATHFIRIKDDGIRLSTKKDREKVQTPYTALQADAGIPSRNPLVCDIRKGPVRDAFAADYPKAHQAVSDIWNQIHPPQPFVPARQKPVSIPENMPVEETEYEL